MEKKNLQILISLCLFLPSVHLLILYIYILLIYLIYVHKIDRVSLYIIIYVLTINLTRLLFTSNLVEINEAIKIISILILMISIFSVVEFSNVYFNILFIFVLINTVFTLLQFFKFNLFGLVYPITEIYSTPTHYEMLSVSSTRAIGLMAGPAQNGVLGFSIFIYSIISKNDNYILLILGLITIVLSQSKTVYLGLFLILIIVTGYKIIKFNYKYISFAIIILLIGFYYLPINYIVTNFREINKLYNYSGGSISSFSARLDRWYDMLAVSFESVFYMIFGVGRSILESHDIKSSVYDSDLIYLYINFGIIGVICILVFFFYFFYINPNKIKYYVLAHLPLIFTINVFFDFKILMILLFIIHLIKYENLLDTY